MCRCEVKAHERDLIWIVHLHPTFVLPTHLCPFLMPPTFFNLITILYFDCIFLSLHLIVPFIFHLHLPGSLQILVRFFFLFGNLGCLIFSTMVSVCKARQATLLKNVDKHFRNFVSQKQRKMSNKNGMKSSEECIFRCFTAKS